MHTENWKNSVIQLWNSILEKELRNFIISGWNLFIQSKGHAKTAHEGNLNHVVIMFVVVFPLWQNVLIQKKNVIVVQDFFTWNCYTWICIMCLRMSIYSYTFDFDTFKNDTFKSVIFRFSQKWLLGSFWHFQKWHFWKCMSR